MPFDTALHQWDAGLRRLEGAPDEQRDVLEDVVATIVDELRRRLGGPFTTDELAELYDREGTAWATGMAVARAPEHPWAWEATTVADAAFGRYLREAIDFAGGRRLD